MYTQPFEIYTQCKELFQCTLLLTSLYFENFHNKKLGEKCTTTLLHIMHICQITHTDNVLLALKF